ncbi:sigma-70 family RNA polymerase sigma factor [Clostridium sp. CTA-5]
MDKNLIVNLYKQQFKIICLYLVKSGCSISEAEDIVHDSFIKVIEYMDGIDIKNLSSWLFRVAINKYKNSVKRGKIINFISVDEDKFYEQLTGDVTIEDKILSMEKREEVTKVLKSLSEEYRSLLIFKYEMELSYKEIGFLLGMNENKVKTYLYRARNKFKERWMNKNER